MDLSIKRNNSSSSSSPPPPTTTATSTRLILPPAPSLLRLPVFTPPTSSTLRWKKNFYPQPPPPPPLGIIPSTYHLLMYQEMERQFQLQNQLQQQQQQMVRSSSSSFSNYNRTIAKNPFNCYNTTTTTTTDNNASYAAESMANLKNNLVEIFPSIIISKDEDDVKFLSRESFKNHAAQAYPFIQFKFDNSDYISYYGLENCSSSDTSSDHKKMEDDKLERLYRLLNATRCLDERTGNENLPWTKLDDVYKKLPVLFRKKKTSAKTGKTREKHREEHADTRLGYRFDNMFLVKRFFTFGERMVDSNEVHIIQTCEVPILYNEFKMEHIRTQRKISLSSTSTTTKNVYNENYDGLFDPTDQKFYNTYVLNPHTIYKIPSNTIYMLITMQKSLFSIDRVDNNKFEKMIIQDFRWQQVEIYPPQAHKQLQIQLPPNGNPVVVCKNVKRKKLLDYEKKWVYNDVLNPPQYYTQPKRIIIEGEEYNDNGIQFTTAAATPYFYFEPNNEYYQQQQQQPEEQQNDVLMSNSCCDENNDETIATSPPPPSNSGSSLQQQQQEQEQNILMSSSNGGSNENNDEMISPVICSYTPPPQQEQEQQNYSNNDERNNVYVKNLGSVQPSPSLNENVELNHTNTTTNLSDESTLPLQNNDKNDIIFDFDDINCLPFPSAQQKKEYDDVLDDLNSLTDNYISSPSSNKDDDDKNNTISIPVMSFGDDYLTEPEEEQQQQKEEIILDNNISSSSSSTPPAKDVIKNCNKLLEELNNFAKEYCL